MVRLVLTFRDNVIMLRNSRGRGAHRPAHRPGQPPRAAPGPSSASSRAPTTPTRWSSSLFDLDGFKHYNDTFGHPAGDALLVRLGASLASYLRRRGDAFRMGGDEFCALFRPGAQVAEPIISGAAAPCPSRARPSASAARTAPSRCRGRRRDAAEALRIADQRMYAHKHSRRAPAEAQSKDVLLQALAERHPELGSHSDVVAELAEATAARLGLPARGGPHRAPGRRAARRRQGRGARLDPQQARRRSTTTSGQFIRRHTLIGERIIAAAPALEAVARLVRSSHERWDGTGYPDALAGEDIPLGSRIVAIADAFDAMTSRRPYCRPRGSPRPSPSCAPARARSSTRSSVEAFGAACAAQHPAAELRRS